MTNKEQHLVDVANDWYLGKVKMTDQEFDRLENEVKAENPDFNYREHLNLDGETVKHYVKFPELKKPQIDKYQLEDPKIKSLLAKLEGKGYVSTPKLSGCSLVIYYDSNGDLFDIITKSNDKNGKRKLKAFQSMVPQKVKPGIHAINCEAIVELDKGLEYMSEAKANGLVNSKLKPKEVHNLLTLVVWDVQLYPEATGTRWDYYKTLFDLETNDFKVIHPNPFSVNSLEWSSKWTDGNISSVIDGYVIYDKDHNLVTALKFYFNESKDVVIKKISWELSDKLGLIPKIKFDPVLLEGHKVKQCASNGIGMLKKMNIGKGSVVTIARVNSTIPQVVHVVDAKGFKYPECPTCGTQLTKSDEIGGVLYCSNPECPDKVKWMRRKVGNVTKELFLDKTDKYTIDLMNIARFDANKKRKKKWTDSDKDKLLECIESLNSEEFLKILCDHFKFNEDNKAKATLMVMAAVKELNNKLFN